MSSRARNSENEPVVQLKNLGTYFHLHRRRKINLRQALIQRRFVAKPEILWALRHLTLELHEGQVLGIVGPNGAGKSTLCLVLSQILQPDEGEITVHGKVSQLVSLSTGLNSELSGRANVRLLAAYLGIPKAVIDGKIQEIIEFSELGNFIDEPMRHYSSGMKARLGFTTALLTHVDILLIDEILSVGDAHFRGKAQEAMKSRIASDQTVVFVSHMAEQVKKMCDRVIWLEEGKIAAEGDAVEVTDAYTRSVTTAREGAAAEQREKLH